MDEGYHNVVVSMKSSNPQVMVQAYRLLVARMAEENMAFPLHLGVTEAGDGEDGRVKSALGIGTLLEDGLGDTVRVSLTEEPEAEMPVGRMLVERYTSRHGHEPIAPVDHNLDPFNYSRRVCAEVDNVGGKHVPVVVHTLRDGDREPAHLFGAGYRYSVPLDKWNLDEAACDYVYAGKTPLTFGLPGTLQVLVDADVARIAIAPRTTHPAVDRRPGGRSPSRPTEGQTHWIRVTRADVTEALAAATTTDDGAMRPDVVWVVQTQHVHAMVDLRTTVLALDELGLRAPVVLRRTWQGLDEERLTLQSATDLGGPMIDGLGDGIWLDAADAPLQ